MARSTGTPLTAAEMRSRLLAAGWVETSPPGGPLSPSWSTAVVLPLQGAWDVHTQIGFARALPPDGQARNPAGSALDAHTQIVVRLVAGGMTTADADARADEILNARATRLGLATSS